MNSATHSKSPVFSRPAQVKILPLLVTLGLVSASAQVPVEERLSLRSVILKALVNNNDILIEDLGRLVEQERVKIASQNLDPRFESSYIYQSIRTPQNTQDFIATGGGVAPGAPIQTTPNTFMQRNHISKVAFVDKLSTGATIELGTTLRVLNNTLNRRIPPGIFNPEWESFTGLTFTQPLLRGFGRDANLAEIRIAKANAKIAVIEVDNLFAIQPVLDDRSLTHDAPFVPFAVRLHDILRRCHAKKQRRGLLTRIFAVGAVGVVEQLILILPRSVVEAAVAALGDLPLETQLKIIRHLRLLIHQRATFLHPRDLAIHHGPVSFVFPAIERLAIKKSLKAGFDGPSGSGEEEEKSLHACFKSRFACLRKPFSRNEPSGSTSSIV